MLIKPDLSRLRMALETLREALSSPVRNDLERDGAIQRFEYTFELAWKTAQRVLESVGLHAASPRGVIRELATQGWLTDPEAWMHFLNLRNMTVHTYRSDVAASVFACLPKFVREATELLRVLGRELDR